MDSARLDALVTWIGQNPIAAGLVIFLIAFGDALVIVGVAIPAVPLLFAVGTLVGLGHVDGTYALACATLGAFVGDGISYWVGHRYGPQLRQHWPFYKHPQWLERGEITFKRHGMKSIVMARYIGAIRPFVPAIAGMLKMKLRQYVPASALAALVWSATFLAPGWLFGTSLELVAAVAGRLAVVLAVVLVLVAAIWAFVFYSWRWLGAHTTGMIERALAWSHRHPVLGRYSEALIDPNRPESASLLLLGVVLLAAGWGFFQILISVGGGSAPSQLDMTVHQLMFGLRNPLADVAMAFLATIGDAVVLTPAVLAVFGWLLWRRRHVAAWHWLAAPAFAVVLTWFLGYLLDMPKPPASTAVLGFSFPSASVTMATVVYGFFAVLIARELPGRRRAWPYVVAALAVSLLGFSRLYLGAHWLSDVLAGILLGLLWIAALGIAYRRRVVRSFWVRPTATIFFVAILGMATWHGSRSADTLLARFDPPLVPEQVDGEAWWRDGWQQQLPARRNELHGRDAWPLNVQLAGPLDSVRARLLLSGWENYRTGGWTGLLQTLDKDVTPRELPVLPATHQGRAEALVMVRRGADPGEMVVLRLWATPLRLQPDREPAWIGTVHTLRFTRRLDFFSYWQAQPGEDALLDGLHRDTPGLESALEARTDDGQRVLRLRPASR
ncbi:bifunctional DedA family/phosphatase PAP2 family protein [Arenimonas sp.]|uniref:bifunctional DedA family/phosphatase PAP2 family protein n=1 Tax=Arenimonas sp. TaxID=1872635 RepID=UPI0025C14C87|nr:bifunctional DedA family/phosphatase PAP2 family protein [Arenimonas sp.]